MLDNLLGIVYSKGEPVNTPPKIKYLNISSYNNYLA